MNFLLDANVGRTIATALTAAGHDVLRVALVAPSASDADVLSLAVAANRILVTSDRDFGELVFGKGAVPPLAIIYIRFRAREVADVLPRLMPLLDERLLAGCITVIDHESTRRRPFPSSG